MRHGMKGRKFGRTKDHRRHLFINLASSLIEHKTIKTTLPKAKDLRPYVEKLVTLARDDSLASYRRLLSILKHETVAKELKQLAKEKMADRPGGYTRIIKAGFRHGDCAPMAYIQFVD